MYPSERLSRRVRAYADQPVVADRERDAAFAAAARVLAQQKTTHIERVHGDNWADPARDRCDTCRAIWAREDELRSDYDAGRI